MWRGAYRPVGPAEIYEKPVQLVRLQAVLLNGSWTAWTALKARQSKTLEETLHEEPIQSVRVVAAQSFGLACRRGIQVPVRDVAAARCRPRRAI